MLQLPKHQFPIGELWKCIPLERADVRVWMVGDDLNPMKPLPRPPHHHPPHPPHPTPIRTPHERISRRFILSATDPSPSSLCMIPQQLPCTRTPRRGVTERASDVRGKRQRSSAQAGKRTRRRTSEQRYACDAVGETQATNGASLRQSGHVGQVELATIGVHAAPKLKQKRHTLTRRVSLWRPSLLRPCR